MYSWIKLITINFSPVDELLRTPREAFGLSIPYFNILLCLLFTYPLAFIFRSLPTPKLKHIFSLVAGVLFAQFYARDEWCHSFGSTTLTYIILLFVSQKYSPTLIFIIAIGWLSYCHMIRMDETIQNDPSGIQMILTIKLTSLAFNIHDGFTISSSENRKNNGQNGHSNHHNDSVINEIMTSERILKERKSRAVYETPSPLEYFGYMYFFGGILTGPAFDFVEYSTSVDLSKYNQHYKDGKKHLPSPFYPAIGKLLSSLIFVAVYEFLRPSYPNSLLRNPEFLYSQRSIFAKFFDILIICFCEKSKYYFVWLIAEGGCNLCYFGFEGYSKDGKPMWGGISNVDVIGFETTQSVRNCTTLWNTNTSLWLRRYVYERAPPPYNLIATYIVSAFWHGFYPGYYLFFFSMGVFQVTARICRTKVRPYFLDSNGEPLPSKRIYDLLGFLVTYSLVHYFSTSFILLYTDQVLELWKSFYFIGHIALLIGLSFSFIPKKRIHHKVKSN